MFKIKLHLITKVIQFISDYELPMDIIFDYNSQYNQNLILSDIEIIKVYLDGNLYAEYIYGADYE